MQPCSPRVMAGALVALLTLPACSSGPQKAASDFLNANFHGQPAAAYALLSAEDRAAVSEEEFSRSRTGPGFASFAERTTWTLTGLKVSGETATVHALMTEPDLSSTAEGTPGPMTDGFTMKTEDRILQLRHQSGQWRVFLDLAGKKREHQSRMEGGSP